jgi:hypothetical protein
VYTRRLTRPALAILMLLLASLACSAVAPTPTAVPPSPLPPTLAATATATPRPTSTPRPTATPNLAATQEAEADQARLSKYLESGYISSTAGTILPLSDNSSELAQMNYLDYFETGYPDQVRDFAAWVNVQLSSAGPVAYPEYSGCGFGFRIKENWDAYTAMVTNDSVLVTWCLEAFGNRCGRVGKTSGKGTVKLPSPAEFQLEFIVQDGIAHALVDGQLIGKYTLFKDRLVEPGYFMYSIVSGTNKGYGTRCTMTNGKIWVPDE